MKKIILALDPGIGRTGYGLLEKESLNNSIRAIEYGCIETSKKTQTQKRFLIIFNKITQLIKKHKPDTLVLEQLFFNTNHKTAITVGQAQGVMLLAAANFDLAVAYLTPPQIKSAITGYGQADKMQVQRMVQTFLNLDTLPKPDDTADALACGLAYLYTNTALIS